MLLGYARRRCRELERAFSRLLSPNISFNNVKARHSSRGIFPAIHLDDEPEALTAGKNAVKLNDQIGFVGAGQMAEALIRGMTTAGVSNTSLMSAFNPGTVRMQVMRELGVNAVENAAAVVEASDIIWICVKPVNLGEVLEEIGPSIGPGQLVVSIAAGVTTHSIETGLADATRSALGQAAHIPKYRVVRVMPNTPCLVREAASAYALGSHATEDDARRVSALLSSVGVALQVPERLLDAVTGLSGSGPAFVFTAIEGMADGGVACGLPREVALRLAAQTFLGAARMVAEGGDGGKLAHPGMLRDSVASPAGTTIAGLRELERAGARAAFMDAVIVATKRSAELSKDDL